MNALAVPIILPLISACVCLLARRRLILQRWVAGVTAHALLALTLYLGWVVRDGDVAVLRVGGWPGTYGIVLALDSFGAIMLVLASLVHTATWWHVAGGGMRPAAELRHFHPLFLLLSAGVNWAFVTGDLFNLFVGFELILMATYVLLIQTGHPGALREGVKFVVLNILAGALFLMAAGIVYGLYGTLNYADLALKTAHSQQPMLAVAAGTLLFIVFAIKAGLFPFFFWLPDAYPQAPPAVTPYFSGILTKVGVYCLYRSHTLFFRTGLEEWFQPLLLGIGGATMIIGVLGALSRSSFRSILSFHIISQIGYMIFGLGLFTQAGLAGGIIFIIHNVLAKSSLLMIAACVILQFGTDSLGRLGGLLTKTPVLAGLFLFAAFSLAGLPPLSGFYGKYMLVVEGVSHAHYAVVAISLVTSLLTLASMVKIWCYAFLGGDDTDRPTPFCRPLALAAAGGLVFMVAAVMVLSGPLIRMAHQASATLMNPEIYIHAVRGAVTGVIP